VTRLRAERSKNCDAVSSRDKIIFLLYKASRPLLWLSLPPILDHREYSDRSVKVNLVLYIFVVTDLSCTCTLPYAFLACARATPLTVARNNGVRKHCYQLPLTCLCNAACLSAEPARGFVHRYTEMETDNCILDERRKEQFPMSAYFPSAVYRNLGCASCLAGDTVRQFRAC
jgi:hypothetical protein